MLAYVPVMLREDLGAIETLASDVVTRKRGRRGIGAAASFWEFGEPHSFLNIFPTSQQPKLLKVMCVGVG